MQIEVIDERELQQFGERFGALLQGGEVIELIGDVGAGKTTLTKAVAAGMGITDEVSSPSYALSQQYKAPNGLVLAHYDFYRLNDPGILASELAETVADTRTVTVIEWAAIIADVVPTDRLQVQIIPLGEHARRLTLRADGEMSRRLIEALR